LRSVKQDIARIRTVLRERDFAVAEAVSSDAAATPAPTSDSAEGAES
jgi:hypothetical protein